jgi:hypothetical protein
VLPNSDLKYLIKVAQGLGLQSLIEASVGMVGTRAHPRRSGLQLDTRTALQMHRPLAATPCLALPCLLAPSVAC